MKKLKSETPSSFGCEVALRLDQNVAKELDTHMRQDSRKEQMAFGLAALSRTAEGSLLNLTELPLPGAEDLSEQSAVGVSPTRQFQSYVYLRAFQTKKAIVEFHTHPGSSTPEFSGIDDRHAQSNALYISRKLPEPVTLALVVGNNRFNSFNGVVYDRAHAAFRGLDRFEVLGRPSETRLFGELTKFRPGELDPRFDRQNRIPGWNQHGIENQRIAIVGVGGNGAQLFQTLLSIGAGRGGFIALFDPQRVDRSNLPRIPYAFEEHVGNPKVAVAAHYAGCKSARTPIYPFPCSVAENAAKERLKMATVIFGCGDNDGVRKELNEVAIRYSIPFIDLGCDIQTNGDSVNAGGQVRAVFPGENACLVCCG
ncbi:MAG: ThiF family adenylyltransferase, partial [Verrucomicrobia bacterium]|nr:ThiF family adenylyltransferase [Verrucomicrobiota bacterium]